MPNSNEHCPNCTFETQDISPAGTSRTASYEHNIVMDGIYGHSTSEFETKVIKEGIEAERILAAKGCLSIIQADGCLIYDSDGNERNIIGVKEE